MAPGRRPRLQPWLPADRAALALTLGLPLPRGGPGFLGVAAAGPLPPFLEAAACSELLCAPPVPGAAAGEEEILFPVTMLQTFIAMRESSNSADVYAYLDVLLKRGQEEYFEQQPTVPPEQPTWEYFKEQPTVSSQPQTGANSTLAPAASADSGALHSNHTTRMPTAADLTGITANQAGDLKSFTSGVLTNLSIILVCILVLAILRPCFPLVYQHKVEINSSEFFLTRKQAPKELSNFLGWATASYRLRIDQVAVLAGLDHAMMLEFSHLSMRILGSIALPTGCILVPMHIWCGGNASGEDNLSKQGMANVVQGSWVCWVHAFFVWYVVVVTQFWVFRAMRAFMGRRFQWLIEMPESQATSILVEDIPEGMRTEAKLRQYFDEHVFGNQAVKTVYFVKDTTELVPWVKKLEAINLQFEQMPGGGKSARRSNFEPALFAQKRECEEQIQRLQTDIEANDALNSTTAFVTFYTRRQTVVACKIFSEADEEDLIVSIPPEPADIIWVDLMANPHAQRLREVIGYGLIVALFFTLMPMVVFITSITSLDRICRAFPRLNGFVLDHPDLATTWNGLVGPLALSLMMGMLPTFLNFIFSTFFLLKAEAWLQFRIQQWYFYFLLVFVLLVTTVASGVLETVRQLVENPLQIFNILAITLPRNTHFYLNYFPVQWAAHATSLTRYVILIKYLFLSRVFERQRAHELSEPEDQDFYGIGSRSARFTLLLVIALVFSTLSPLILLLGIVNFALSRLFYGYLFVYAETVKADLGGEFYVQQLKHLQEGLFIFVALMTGVLLQRSTSVVPAIIAGSSFVFVYYTYGSFKKDFRWEFLEFAEIDDEAPEVPHRKPKVLTYKQPELPVPVEEEPVRQSALQCVQQSLLKGDIQQAMLTVSQRLFAPKPESDEEDGPGPGPASGASPGKGQGKGPPR